MTWRQPLALFLALLLLLSSSGAATLCTEADGSVRVELLAAVCCDPTPTVDGTPSQDGPGLRQVPPCAGCDDQPLDEARWSRDKSSGTQATLTIAPSPISILVSPPDSAQRLVDLARWESGTPSPRAARPSILRC